MAPTSSPRISPRGRNSRSTRDLNIAIPDLTQFAADPQAALPLQGPVDAKGNVTLRNGVYGGGFDLQSRDLQAKGATVRTADVVVGVENNRATSAPATSSSTTRTPSTSTATAAASAVPVRGRA